MAYNGATRKQSHVRGLAIPALSRKRSSDDTVTKLEQDVVRILLVEDNEMNRDMLSRRLRRRGFEVIMAVDGKEGINMAAKDSPDLILLDMDLPVLNGWDVARKLKSLSNTATIPIIALTAHAMVGDREEALAAGCDDYDTKPVDLGRLLSKIKFCLEPK